jgi:serine phosphatase RsbU (regulator of sigma subunit)
MNTDKSMTLTLFDYSQVKLQLSGQHEEVIIVLANREVELLDRTVDLGFPIALIDDISDCPQVQLNSGDVVVLYTDGITEAINMNQEQ